MLFNWVSPQHLLLMLCFQEEGRIEAEAMRIEGRQQALPPPPALHASPAPGSPYLQQHPFPGLGLQWQQQPTASYSGGIITPPPFGLQQQLLHGLHPGFFPPPAYPYRLGVFQQQHHPFLPTGPLQYQQAYINATPFQSHPSAAPAESAAASMSMTALESAAASMSLTALQSAVPMSGTFVNSNPDPEQSGSCAGSPEEISSRAAPATQQQATPSPPFVAPPPPPAVDNSGALQQQQAPLRLPPPPSPPSTAGNSGAPQQQQQQQQRAPKRPLYSPPPQCAIPGMDCYADLDLDAELPDEDL